MKRCFVGWPIQTGCSPISVSTALCNRGHQTGQMLTQDEDTVSDPWWGHDPSDKQWHGLDGYEDCPDLFYGGAAGPGKTSYLLMAAVQYVQYPHYRALLDEVLGRFRREGIGVDTSQILTREEIYDRNAAR